MIFRRESPPVPIYFYRAMPDEILFQGRKFSVRAFPVSHRGRECYGYIFEEDARRPFLAEKADALGIPARSGARAAGRRRNDHDAKRAASCIPMKCWARSIQGAKVVITGDLARTDDIREAVQGADALVIEATYLDRDADIARQVGHITARQAAENWRANATSSFSFLTHVSRRYREFEVIREVRKFFPNSYVARDLDHFAIFPRQIAAENRSGQDRQHVDDDPPEGGE